MPSFKTLLVGSGAGPDGPNPAPDTSLPLAQLGLIVRDLAHRAGADVGSLTIVGPGDRTVQIGAGTHSTHDAYPAVESETFVSHLIRTGVSCAGVLDPGDTSLGAPISDIVLRYAFGAAVRPPGQPPGALCIGFAVTPPRDRRRETLWTVERYAGLAALCLHDPDLLEGLLANARLDGLTGCLNHRAIRSTLEREIGLSVRSRRPVCCCFIDLDHFKAVNDVHGHQYGSQVLAEVASILRHNVRRGDAIGRYGGDEFVAVLPDTDHSTAVALAERLRAAISESTVIGARQRLGASIGVAQAQPGTAADHLLEAADRALLAAKRAGGGVVVSARTARPIS